MAEIKRPDGRQPDQLRPVTIQPGIAPNADGSVLISFGNTSVICSASVEEKVPGWMRAQGITGGWTTAEYSMLPYSTLERKARDISKGKQDGRSVEIQRLIGRSLRAAIDLSKLPGLTIWVDCDVLQADGGTRTAAITGAWAAMRLACNKLLQAGRISEDPIRDHVAAVSVGIVEGLPLLDLCYVEDRDASVDCNIVMTGAGRFVEVQGTGEESTFARSELDTLLDLASAGIAELVSLQTSILAVSK